MKSAVQKVKTSLLNFHENEDGDAMQTVMIIAIAAMVVVAIIAVGNRLIDWGDTTTKTMVDTEVNVPD